ERPDTKAPASVHRKDIVIQFIYKAENDTITAFRRTGRVESCFEGDRGILISIIRIKDARCDGIGQQILEMIEAIRCDFMQNRAFGGLRPTTVVGVIARK